MPTLTDEIKIFIVKALARYDTPSQVVEAVKTSFGVEISRQQAHSYDPQCSKPPAQRWQDLHAATRRAFLTELGEIGVAQKAVRLKMLNGLALRAEANRFSSLMAALLEQAARECGGHFDGRPASAIALAAPAKPSSSALPPDGRSA